MKWTMRDSDRLTKVYTVQNQTVKFLIKRCGDGPQLKQL